MGALEDVTAAIAAFNDATNTEAAAIQAVSDRIDKLIAELGAGTAGGLTADDVKNVLAQLGTIKDAQAPVISRLQALGADPANPVPAPPA